MFCRICGKERDDDAKFCPICGKELVKMMKRNRDIVIIKGIAVDLYPASNESFQDFVRRTIDKLLRCKLLEGNKLDRMFKKDDSKDILGLQYALFVRTSQERFVSGHSRYWAKPIGGYYVCSEWWKDNIPIHREKFAAWLKTLQ